MIKRMILCFLCVLIISAAGVAEGLPAQTWYCKVHMYEEIPEKTMKSLLEEYMVPGCEATYEDNMAYCESLINGGDSWWLIPDPAIDQNERISSCQAIAEKILHEAYPGDEQEIITAMSFRTFKEKDLKSTVDWELKDGQWYFMGKVLTHELEGALIATRMLYLNDREKIDRVDPDWTILQYHPGPVCGLPVGIWLDDGKEYMDFCLTTFIFDAENHIVSVQLGGGFSAEPIHEATVTVTKEEALRVAMGRDHSEETFDWRIRGWEVLGDANAYDCMLKELGYTSIRSRMVPVNSARLVMAMNRKGQLQPAWECCDSYQVLADDQVIHELNQGLFYYYLSAEDGSLLNP